MRVKFDICTEVFRCKESMIDLFWNMAIYRYNPISFSCVDMHVW